MQTTTATYKNPWHDGTQNYGPAMFVCPTEAKHEYRGFKVFHRSGGFDYVINGVCVTVRAGATKYKEVIDGILEGNNYFDQRARENMGLAGRA